MAQVPTLALSGVSYGFTKERDAVSNVTADFPPATLSCVIGPNGSGKSTLLRIAGGLLVPDKGEVCLDGESVFALPRKERARRMAMVPQREELLPEMAALDMVLLGRTPYIPPFGRETEKDKELAYQAMEMTGVAQLSGRAIDTLSGGELQRVAIARALCQDTPVLLLDEPVASLDIRHQVSIMELLATLAAERGLCVVCILHDINLAAHYAHRLLLLKDSRLLSMGACEEVLTPPLLREAYGIDVRRISEGGHFALTPDFERASPH